MGLIRYQIMKRIIIQSLLFAISIMLLSGCITSNAARKLDSFVDDTELKSDSYNADDWKKSISQYERLVEEYSTSRRTYTDAEKQMAARAIGRYHSLMLKYGIEASAAFLEELKSVIPSYLEGLIEGLEENTKGLEKTLEGLFEGEDFEQTLGGLSEQLENIFEFYSEE